MLATSRIVLLGSVALLLASGCADDAPGASGRARATPTTAGPLVTAPSVADVAPTLAPSAAAPATAATDGSGAGGGLELRSATASVEAAYDPAYDSTFVMPGVYVGAIGGPFEVTARRSDYDSPITATLRAGSRSPAVLPSGTVSTWDGLDDFLGVQVTRADGTVVDQETAGFCPAALSPQRLSGDSPLADGYVAECGGNPFTLGATWGLTEGWAAPVLEGGLTLPIGPGSYTLTVTVAAPYAALVGSPAPVTVGLTVTAGDGTGDTIDTVPFDTVPFDTVDPTLDPGAGKGGVAFTDLGPGDGSGFGGEDLITDAGGAGPAHRGRPTPDAHPAVASLPDLVPLPAYDISVGYDETSGLDVLGFAADTWNRGPAPLVVDGFLDPADSSVMNATQQFFADGLATGSAPIGTLEYHRGGGHDHWHFLDFERYELVSDDGTVVQRSAKESWCLAPTDAIDLTRPGAEPRPDNTNLSTACGDRSSLWVREALPAGWGDTYTPFVSGQWIDVTDLPNGAYVIRITANPEGNLYEGDTTNDTSERRIVLDGVPGARTVEVEPYGLVDSEGQAYYPGFGSYLGD